MAGAPVDALGADGTVTEPTHLLWPATEAGKYYAWRHLARRDKAAAEDAHRLERVVFSRFFASENPPVWHNQLDAEARPMQPVALSRLVYHVALFVTEGARAGLWHLAESDTADTIMNREELT
ncbi:hypothetical protein OCH239_07040 [Roseivivax halodurans JCM 10272]|uniref:Uncharacterized protein n=1 Tax=Roseivivax halodurans JCM 10272 TaxID=1449350 RepID=X7EER6_9RHOB|nr:hypothetical protein OCH239_07040 [Roseivivax halodurans JCM 10272]